MFCFTARKLINLEMDGLLPAHKTRALEEHVTRCRSCSAFRAELDTGKRLLQATASEPSEAFEWKMQLKLNQALQEAAASNTVPWEEPARGTSGWLRSFALSSLAGVALTALVAVWILPLDRGGVTPVGTGPMASAEFSDAASPVTLSAGDADRRSITVPRSRMLFPESGGLGRTVGGRSVQAPNFLDRSGWIPPSWSASDMQNTGALSTLREENGRLRFMLQRIRIENAHLKSLLADRDINYLEPESEEGNP